MRYITHALYKFVSLPDYTELQAPILDCCLENGVIGTLLLAEEGINGTISGSREGLQSFWDYLRKDMRFADIEYKESVTDTLTFYRMKVRLKKEIVSMGEDGIDPNKAVGQYVDPADWNELISDPEVTVIDTRNDYEVDVGTFKGAVNPNTESFREFPDYVRSNLDPKKHPRVAMYCTGGIRCEKATALMLKEGFEEVYHLKGGILKYLEDVPEKDSLWEGECFVFDNRVTVNHKLEKGEYELCHACRHPITSEDIASEYYEAGASCPYCHDTINDADRHRFRERQKQMRLAESRGTRHIGSQQ